MSRPSVYLPEFRQRAVDPARGSDRPIAQVARGLGVNHKTPRAWVRQAEADAACPRTGEGRPYPAVVPDACNRRVVGWPASTSLASEPVIDAVGMAVHQRAPRPAA